MTDTLKDYKAAQAPLPGKVKRWHLTGAGLESLHEATIDLPQPGPDELLVRHDAVGICASDIKIINLGPQHPKLIGRDFQAHPVVLGHEVALTVVEVGDEIKDQFKVGQRFIIQADIYNNGVSTAYGYTLDGGMAQYGLITKEALRGDDGCYLIPLQDSTGYAEAALVEPWACVVAAYQFPNYRTGLRDGGHLLVVSVNGKDDSVSGLIGPGHQPAKVTVISNLDSADWGKARVEETGGNGFDDILVYGTPTAGQMGGILTCLGDKGILNLVRDKPLTGLVPVDVGRVHYEQQIFVSTDNPKKVAEAYLSNRRTDLKAGGKTWLVGAGGPMGQMHVQRIANMAKPPKTIVVTDHHAARLERLEARFGKLLKERHIGLVLVNPTTDGLPTKHGPFDDIVCLVSFASAITESVPHLAEDGVYNLFAGLAKGVTADLDLGALLVKNQRLVGTSGSGMSDIKRTLDLVEANSLSTSSSLAAIGGLDAFRDGLEAVKEGRFPGKTVIFPLIDNLPLTSVDEMKTRLPNVYAKLQDGTFWTQDAEEELLRERLGK